VRILVAHPGSDFSVSDVHEGYVKALKTLGHDVAVYNLNDRLVFFANCLYQGKPLPHEQVVEHAALGIHSKLYEWWPDLVIVISGFYVMPITWNILKHRPHKTAVIFTECPYEDDRHMNLVEQAEPDVVILNDPKHIKTFRDAHPRVEYLPHCYDPDIHYPGTGPKDLDFTFVGTGYPSRIELLEKVDWTGLNATLAGHWGSITPDHALFPLLRDDPKDCIFNADAADLYRRSKMSANMYRGKSPIEANAPELQEGWAVGPREIELAACRTAFLRESRGEGDELFPMLPIFEGPDDFAEKLDWFLVHDDARDKAAAEAQARIADRKFSNNAKRLLQLVDNT
jgi:spore maturation protein CgeB